MPTDNVSYAPIIVELIDRIKKQDDVERLMRSALLGLGCIEVKSLLSRERTDLE